MTTERQQLLQKASAHLAAQDPTLALIIQRAGPCTIAPHTNYYRELVDSIISQQLSVKAAATIFGRFVDLFGGDFPTPQDILAKDVDQLRSAGLSRSKANYVQDLAEHILDGRLKIDELTELSNDEVITELVAVKGIGEWTAHMFLIFSLGRLDVLATGDLGLRTAMMRLYHMPALPTPDDMRRIATMHHWHPYESVAGWYLWKALDNEPLATAAS